jgi:hypothetical protein
MKRKSEVKVAIRYFVRDDSYDVIVNLGAIIISQLTNQQAKELAEWLLKDDKTPGEIYYLPIAEFEIE